MTTKSVKKAVIPVAGLGTRFIPATKAIPKEMLPIVDKPSILYIVEEAVESGIEDIIFVTGRHKGSLEEFFDRNYEQEAWMEKRKQTELLSINKSIAKLANIISVRQKDPLGLGHAILKAASIIGDEPFAVLLGDEIMYREKGPNVTKQLIEMHAKTEKSVVGIIEVPKSETSSYGIAAVEKTKDSRLFKMTGIVEKPAPEKAPSTWALPGRYLFNPSIFNHLQDVKPSKNGEIQLTDGMEELIKDEGIFGYAFEGERYDVGSKLGYLRANIEYGLRHPETGKDLKAYLKQVRI